MSFIQVSTPSRPWWLTSTPLREGLTLEVNPATPLVVSLRKAALRLCFYLILITEEQSYHEHWDLLTLTAFRTVSPPPDKAAAS